MHFVGKKRIFVGKEKCIIRCISVVSVYTGHPVHILCIHPMYPLTCLTCLTDMSDIVCLPYSDSRSEELKGGCQPGSVAEVALDRIALDRILRSGVQDTVWLKYAYSKHPWATLCSRICQ